MKENERMKMFYGALIGDMVGSVYEFSNIKTKDFPFWHKNCFATDDSIMTLAIAKALTDAVEDGTFDTRTDPEWMLAFQTAMRAVGRLHPHCGYGGRFRAWMYEDGTHAYNSRGNGSAMRVSPVAWFARSLAECERLAMLTALPTHNHPDGIAGAQATAGAAFLALHGAAKEEIKAYVERFYRIGFTLDEIRPTYRFGRFEALCEGTVPYAVEAFLESADFDDCIRNTVSIGGDTDTLGAISGAIAEAYYGVPEKHYGAVAGRLQAAGSNLWPILRKLDGLDWPKA